MTAGKPAWSLQRRLAVSLVLCIGGTFVALMPALDIWIDREIYQRMDLTLMQRAAAVGRVVHERRSHHLERLLPEYGPDGHTEFFTVYDKTGAEVLLRSPNSAGVALPLGPVDHGTPRYYDLALPDGHAGRALATRVPMHEGESALLVIATERESWDQTERRIHFTLLGGIALATLLATALALGLVRRVIATLHRAGAAVASLSADRPMQRIEGDFPRELQPFVDAFNTGLDRLYAAIERERRFSRDVAHELRTPLAEIRVSAESALGDTDPEHARRGLKAAIAACARMQRGVDTLLLLARLESGQHTPEPDPLDLAALLRELIAAVRGSTRAVSVRAEFPASAWVQSDQGVIERIISNLLRNAIEYAPRGDEITCVLERGGAGWLLSIGNAAPDFDASDLDRLGARFWRKQPEGGTAHHAGLGLALAFALARAVGLPLEFDLSQGRLTARLGPWLALE
jgi:two-component system sensor histidine kinase QseC